MIRHIIVYGLAVGVLTAVGSWLLERAQVHLGRPRRLAWMCGIAAALVVPALMIVLSGPRTVTESPISITLPAAFVAGAATPADGHSILSNDTDWQIDGWLAGAWALTSLSLIGIYGLSAWRLQSRARAWHVVQLDQGPVMVAPDVGPAVFGWARPCVVFPHWLMHSPGEVHRLALVHEREHVSARDPQVLSAATLLAALLPWNLPILWMLRRLRFAMEVDCDARVIRRGVDPSVYGLALLYVSERQSRAPIPAIALIERTSQLERRINLMSSTPHKHRVLLVGLCLALAGSCLYGATKLDAPRIGAADLVRKPPPSMDKNNPGVKLGEVFERLISESYPDLLSGNFDGMPMIVVQLNNDLSVAKLAKTQNPDPSGKVNVTNEVFRLLNLAPEEVPHVGAMSMQMAKDKVVLVAYTERRKPGDRFVSNVFPDTRRQDRALFVQQFPDSKLGVAAGEDPWVLLDRSGTVLRRGLEPIATEWNRTLEDRYRGIKTAEATVTSIYDEAGDPLRDIGGKELHLHSVWLAKGSPIPQN